MTSPGDRPAAELLAELDADIDGPLPPIREVSLSVAVYRSLLVRLACAEQSLAEIKKLADDFDGRGRWASAADIRAALRASQGGQT